MTKWGERPHWAFDARYLGSDPHGEWVGIPAGTVMVRPAARFVTVTDQVTLVPPDQAWLATFHAPGWKVATYVDMTTVPYWSVADGVAVCHAVDLDLDVVKAADGEVFVDDEDEFAEHRVRFGYPPEIISLATEAAAAVRAAVKRQQPPFDDDSSRPWFAALDSLDASPS